MKRGVADEHGLPLVPREDGDVDRPGPVPDATRPPGVVSSRRDEGGHGAGGQRRGKAGRLRLPGEIAVEDVASKHDGIAAVLAHELGQAIELAREIFAPLRPATAILDVFEAWRHMDVRAVEDPHDD